MENEQIQTNKEYKVIIKPSVARKLLKLGNPIIDIKPNKNNPTEATVFVFEKTEKFVEDLKEQLKNKI
jgi:hypothetical protein